MNTNKQTSARNNDKSQNHVSHLVRLAALGVLAGVAFSSPGRAHVIAGTDGDAGKAEAIASINDDTVNDQGEPTIPSDVQQSTAAVNAAPIADVPEPTATEPKTPGPVTPNVPSTQPSTPDVKAPTPVTPDVKTPEVATPDVKTPSNPVTAATPAVPGQPAAASQPTVMAKPVTPAEPSLVASGTDANGAVNLMVNRSAVITTRVPYSKVHVAAPDVVEPILMEGSKQVLLNAKKPGSTELMIWDAQGHSQVVDIVVGFDLRGLDSQLKAMFPKAKIKVEIANGTIVLEGHVPDLLTAQKAAEVATPYGTAGGTGASSVLNFLEVSGGQQVVLQVRFAEVTRTVQQNLGFNAFATDGKFAFGAGNGPLGATPTLGNAGTNSTFPLYGGAMMGNTSFEYFISALRTNGLLRILAEPNLTAISGQQASFLAGGEIPILVPQASGGGSVTTVDYKQYGIQLNFTPTVLGDGRIRLLCSPQVSDLDYAHAVNLGGEPVPALTTRNVNTTVELAEGQTFALAGLLKNEITANKSITPLLGDMPVLGALFRSVSYNRQETELVILVTPHMVEALNPNQVPQLPGDPWRDPTEAQLFANADLGGPAPDTRHAPSVRSSRFYGFTGYAPATPPQK